MPPGPSSLQRLLRTQLQQPAQRGVIELRRLFMEEAARHPIRLAMQVFGSDIDARALATAREGRFPIAVEADVSEARLGRFFSRQLGENNC